jgi:hypothetical protein
MRKVIILLLAALLMPFIVLGVLGTLVGIAVVAGYLLVGHFLESLDV